MLTDTIMDEEFEIREEEPWYDQQDLERDLHLAAELGKTLLDRNRELEEGLQQMYSTNQEQLQEIDYLTKQVELLRQVNEQHAKVYEQLDQTARELEQANQKLMLDGRTSQQKIVRLTETVEGLQAQVEDLQRRLEELQRMGGSETLDSDLSSRRRSASHQSVSCLKELYDLRKYFVYDHIFAQKISSQAAERNPAEEENTVLKQTVEGLQAQLLAERQKREAIEEEVALVEQENVEMERRLCLLDGCEARMKELEGEVEELKQMCRSDSAFVSRVEKLLPESFLLSFQEVESGPLSYEDDKEINSGLAETKWKTLKRCSSETSLKNSSAAEEILRGHDQTCIRRSEAVRQRGISLLNEVDAQYSALKVKYEELLRKCHLTEDGLSHKAVQTTRRNSQSSTMAATPSPDCAPKPLGEMMAASASTVWSEVSSLDNQQPEYKALFKEIFSCLKKTKEELRESRGKQKTPTEERP
ncbi:cerebellar degeneration-related protein 2-like [Erpetoichthys calabaricus]|uniref:cerebellar degeneration-related protein 2-like n=1 Tax=Erpetoichthys calabaricus TaxID=27687 RepID=UPI002234BB28|nr:cerebellar degeneration-related protein 2-like [Erpetoichthys calabaricus]